MKKDFSVILVNILLSQDPDWFFPKIQVAKKFQIHRIRIHSTANVDR